MGKELGLKTSHLCSNNISYDLHIYFDPHVNCSASIVTYFYSDLRSNF